MAAELVEQHVALIVTAGGDSSALAAKAATSTIPLLIITGGDPVQKGLVVSLNRPGGNITGATIFAGEMDSKRLGLLHEVVPSAKTVAVLVNPNDPNTELQLRLRASASNWLFSMPAPKANSRVFSLRWRSEMRAGCSSGQTHFSTAAARA